MSHDHPHVAPALHQLPDLRPGSLPSRLALPGPPAQPFDLTLRPPGSKSLTNRALLIAALAHGTSALRQPLIDAEDARVMIAALRALGADIAVDPGPATSPASGAPDAPPPSVRVAGVGGRWRLSPGQTLTLNLANAGTATRFLAAAALLAPAGASVIIDGDARMRQRPIGELAAAITAAAGPAACQFLATPGTPPLRIAGGLLASPPNAPARISLSTTLSSQFISAMLLLGPFLPHGLRIDFTGPITSEPYVSMTLALLARLGAIVSDHRPDWAQVSPQPAGPASNASADLALGAPTGLRAFELGIEPDASGATYLLAAAALVPGARVTVPGLDTRPGRSMQGDARFVEVLRAMGAPVSHAPDATTLTGPASLRPIDADLADMPDTAMTAAVLACFAQPTPSNPAAVSTLGGLRTLRHKETDRLAALVRELAKLGATAQVIPEPGDDEALRIVPPPPPASRPAAPHDHTIVFDTYKDHRMAMALALAALRRPGVVIDDPACVAKTYPGYWQHLARVFANET